MADPAAPRMPLHRKHFVVLLLLVALAAGAVALARMTPAWWSSTARNAAGALDTARSLGQGIASETTNVCSEGVQPWRVRVHAADVNAWLSARLPQWLEYDQSLARLVHGTCHAVAGTGWHVPCTMFGVTAASCGP